MLNKPYFRTYRPNKKSNFSMNLDCFDYFTDMKNCSYRKDLIRIYKLLEQELLNIFNYIEPYNENLKTYSIKNYILLCQICIEIENNFKGILRDNDVINDHSRTNIFLYSKLNKHMKFNEYTIFLLLKGNSLKLTPFSCWNNNSETSPTWYKAYNNLKHDRSRNFKEANLENVINALAALYIILYSQFWIYSLEVNSEKMLITESLSFSENSDVKITAMEINPFFEIINEPKWSDDEKYDFDWDTLKNTPDSFDKLNI